MASSKISHYRLLKKIGEGGMGVVFRAEDTTLSRPVALKFLPSHLAATEEDRSRFLQEARAAATLNHPNVCTIHGIEREGDRQFIVMEYVDGITLGEKIARAGGNSPLPLHDALSYAIQVAEALQEAHRLGIVHRDIKPDNIMINSRNQVKVMDFGLAKLKGSLRLTRGPRIIGTPGYMAPEQIQGGEVDPRADIFSLGVVMYEMLTGRPPFSGDHDAALIYSVISKEPLPVGDLRAGVPPPLESLVLRALNKDPRNRFQSATEMLVELKRISRTSIPASGISIAGSAHLPPSARLRQYAGTVGSVLRPRTLFHKLVLIALVALAAVLVWVLAPARSLLLNQSDFLVVADFDNRTGDSVLNNSLTQALRVKLRESTQFNVLSADRVSTARELLRVPDSSPLDDRTAIAVARREGARAVVAGNAARLGSTYVLTAAIIDASTGTTVDLPHEEVSKIEEVLSAMDRLSGRVRKGLGESIARISKANSPLPEATTSSLQALELYSRSENLANSGNYKDAAVLCQEAVSLDSEFVLAISRLAYSYRKIGQDSLAAVMHNRILPLIHRVSERERLDIFVNYYGPSFEIDFQKARESAVKLTLMYPHDADAFQYLGHLSMFAGDTKSALEANARAVSLDQGEEQTCFHNSAYALELANRSEEALDWFRKAKTLRPDYLSIDMNTALTYWSIGQIDSADTALVRAFGAATGHQRNQIRVLMISLDYFRGNLSAARALCREGLRECAILKRPWDEGYFHLLLGEIASAEGNMGEYRSQMNQAAGMSASPYADLALVGWSYARNGLQRDAERILTRIDAMRSYDPWFIRYRPGYRDLIRGEILLRNGDYAKSRVEFRNIEKVLSGDIIYCLGQLGLADCANRSSDANAPAFYDSLQSLRGETFLGSLFSVRRSGFWTRWLWPDAEFEVGKIYASRNQNTQAVEHLNRGLQFLKNADSGDRRASSARSLLVKITGGK